MTPRERILAALAGQEVDRIPWVPLCSPRYLFSLQEYRSRFSPDWRGSLWPAPSGSWEDELKFRVRLLRNIGADFMSWGEAGGIQADTFAMRQVAYEGGIEVMRTREGDRITTLIETPLATLRRVVEWHPDSFTAYTVEHALKEPEDWRVQEYILEHTVLTSDAQRTEQTVDIIGEDGVAFVGFPGSPVMKWLMDDLTLEQITYALADASPEITSFERKQHEFNLRVCHLLAQDPGRIFCNMAVLGTAMASPKVVREHYLPYLKEYVDILRAAGKFAICHTSGEPVGAIVDCIDELAPIVLYGIRQFDEPNAPDMVRLREVVRDDVVLAGGLDPDFLHRSSPSEIRDQTLRLLDAIAGTPGTILATADDTSYGTPLQNLDAVSRAVEEFCA